MMAAVLAFISMDWIYDTYNVVGPRLATFFRSEEFVLPFGAIGLAAVAVLIGWRAKAMAIGHRQRNIKVITREDKDMKVARQIRLEDAILKAIDAMIADKSMSHGQAKNSFREFANKMGLTGLLFRSKESRVLGKFKLKALREKTLESLVALRKAPVLPLPRGEEVIPTKRNFLGVVTARTRVKVAA